MSQVIEIPLETLTPEAFSSFGQIVSSLPTKPNWSRPGLDAWTLNFILDGRPELKVVRFHHQGSALGREFEVLERHTAVTETRIPLGGSQAILIVAPPTAISQSISPPSIDTVRAFFLDGSKGAMLWKGTWHALDCFPVKPPSADFLFITEVETEIEVEKLADMALAHRTDVVSLGHTLKIADPCELLYSQLQSSTNATSANRKL
jgi:ureidoglycolate hydrolase